MPQIRPYEIQTSPAGPTDIPRARGEQLGVGEALTNLGQGVSAVAAGVEDIITDKELNEQAKDFSELQLDFTKRIQDGLNSRTLNYEDIKKQYEDYSSKLSEKYSTRRGSNSFVRNSASLREYILKSTMAGQAEIAGVQAKENIQASLNNLTSSLMMDPSAESVTKQTFFANLDPQLSKFDPQTQMKIKQMADVDLTKSAIRGWINDNPIQAKKRIVAGEWDKVIDGDLKNQLIGEAETEHRALLAEESRLFALQEKALKLEQEKVETDFFDKFSEGRLSYKEIKNSILSSDDKYKWRKRLEDKTTEKRQSNNTLLNSVFDRINLPYGDPNKITDQKQLDQYFNQLSVADFNFLRREVAGKNTVEGKRLANLEKALFDVAKSELVKGGGLSGMSDPAGEAQLKAFREFYIAERDKAVSQGLDPKELLESTSPKYIGKYIKPNFKRPLQEIIRSNADSMRRQEKLPLPGPYKTPVAAPSVEAPRVVVPDDKKIRPNESIQEYKARMGIK